MTSTWTEPKTPQEKLRWFFNSSSNYSWAVLLCWYLHQTDEEAQFGKAREVSCVGIINIVDDMLVCFNKTVPDLHYLFYLHDHSKQELYQILYQRNRTRSNSPKSPWVLVCINRLYTILHMFWCYSGLEFNPHVLKSTIWSRKTMFLFKIAFVTSWYQTTSEL